MTVELRPMGVTCNLGCIYCYQNPMRDAGNITKPYDMEAMKKSILEEGSDFSIFGGEPLLTPIEDLEELWRWGIEQFGERARRKGRHNVNSIQTNGSLITDKHIELFQKYKVGVGISIDGPGEMNDIRWAGSLEKTREMTRKTEENIKKLCDIGRPPGLIITLHRLNASKDKIRKLQDWILELEKMGVRSARLHILEVDNPALREKYALSIEENLEAFKSMAKFEAKELSKIKFDKFQEMIRLLQGRDNAITCVWNHCDPWTTSAVRGVEGNGEKSNCGRTNKEGIDWYKADTEGWERYISLYNTPQEYGGCQGCRFFLQCKGQCPGTSIDGDWRNKSEYCEVWKGMFAYYEEKLLEVGIQPISKHPIREKLEKYFIQTWINGGRPTMEEGIQLINSNTANRAPDMVVPVGSRSGSSRDQQHGDQHGDHYDAV